MGIDLTIEELDEPGICSMTGRESMGVIVTFKDESGIGQRFISYGQWWKVMRFKRGPKPKATKPETKAQTNGAAT